MSVYMKTKSKPVAVTLGFHIYTKTRLLNFGLIFYEGQRVKLVQHFINMCSVCTTLIPGCIKHKGVMSEPAMENHTSWCILCSYRLGYWRWDTERYFISLFKFMICSARLFLSKWQCAKNKYFDNTIHWLERRLTLVWAWCMTCRNLPRGRSDVGSEKRESETGRQERRERQRMTERAGDIKREWEN